MKKSKKLFALLLSCIMVIAMMPAAVYADDGQSNKTTITTVNELLQFAQAVDNGEYDNKTGAVVSLDADLNLTGVEWKPIGSFDGDGNPLHYFSGKFYGNGHTISNLDFSKNYGKAEYPVFGFFSVAYGAEISSLTIQGKLDVSNSGYVYFGTVAGVAENSKISDCVSNVSFTDTDKYINGTAALCGYAINSTIEHCQNKGNFSVTTATTSLQMGGIVGLAQNSTVQYCANTGDMTSWTPHTGGIVGQLYQGSKIINCYSTGKMVPLGYGTTNFGGIAGTVGAGTEIRHCYFAGEMVFSQYTATTPYTRLGGIAGGVSSNTPGFENNYFIETENATACSKYTDAGTEKTLDFMKTEDFFNEITAVGGNYQFNPNGTPILPAPKYAVSFVVTPAELANVVIKVNVQEVEYHVDLEAGTYNVDLEAGTHNVEVTADGYELLNKEITITADTATHTQTLELNKKYSGGSYIPKDNVTNNPADKSTTADLTPVVKGDKAETTVDAKTADKIVDKAVENKSTKIMIDAAGNNTVASSEVAIPEKTVKELAEKTDADLVIKTDNGKVDLDKTALDAVAAQAGNTGFVRLIIETIKSDENICHVNLKLITSNGAVKDFNGGNVKVTINLTKELAAKDVVCVYINDNGIYTLVEGVLNADGTYTFTTGHFSEYAVMAKDEADKVIAEQLNTLIKEVNLKVRTSKTSKKNIKAVVSGDITALTDAGYTVKYKFYKSTKKASKYKAVKTKDTNTYINTAGKKGTKYYYKAKALVYSGDTLVGQTVLKQCKYGVRTWSK